MKFEIVKANIIDVVSDAIVLPANEGLKEGPDPLKLSLVLLVEKN